MHEVFCSIAPNLEGMSKEALDAGLSLLRMNSSESTVTLDEQIKAGIVMHGSLGKFHACIYNAICVWYYIFWQEKLARIAEMQAAVDEAEKKSVTSSPASSAPAVPGTHWILLHAWQYAHTHMHNLYT